MLEKLRTVSGRPYTWQRAFLFGTHILLLIWERSPTKCSPQFGHRHRTIHNFINLVSFLTVYCDFSLKVFGSQLQEAIKFVLYNGWFLRKLFHYFRKNDKLTIEVSNNLAIIHLHAVFVLLPFVFSRFIKLIVLILQAIVLKFVSFSLHVMVSCSDLLVKLIQDNRRI